MFVGTQIKEIKEGLGQGTDQTRKGGGDFLRLTGTSRDILRIARDRTETARDKVHIW